jgi:hypothetical protein
MKIKSKTKEVAPDWRSSPQNFQSHAMEAAR